MHIKLFWQNKNTIAVTTNIYRGTTALDRTAPGTPIASLTAGETEYIDTDVVRGTTYYYLFEVVSPNDRAISPNIEVSALPRTGPGPQTLKAGDYEYGYFGEVPSSMLFNGLSLAGALDFTAGTHYNTSVIWHKWVREGKVIYVPEKPFRYGVSWNQLYDAGLVYGVDGDGPFNSGTPRNQLRKVSLSGEEFIVRLLQGGPPNPAGTFTLPTTVLENPLETAGSEWDLFIYPLAAYVPTTQAIANVASKTNAELGVSGTAAHTLCQEVIATTNSDCLRRGANGTSKSHLTQMTAYPCNAANSTSGWRPVLEYVPVQTVAVDV